MTQVEIDIDDEITNKLIPKLVAEGKLRLKNESASGDTAGRIKSTQLSRLGEDGTFMLSHCCKVQVVLVGNDHADSETVHNLVVKYTPNCSDEFYTLAQFESLFSNEITAYEKIVPDFEIQHCQYLYSFNISATRACVVLGDFSYDGFRMAKQLVNLPLDHVFAAVNELGRFHGNGYALKLSNPEKFQKIISLFLEARFGETQDLAESNFGRAMKDSITRGTNAIREEHFAVPEEFLLKLEKLLEDPASYQRSKVKPTEPLAVICHGDYLRNNIAFSYEKDDEEHEHPTEVLIFDYQTLRYSSPGVDLATFMCCSVGWRVRKEHFTAIFDSYTNEIFKVLEMKNVERAEFLTRENLLREYAKQVSFAYTIASSFIWLLHEPEPPVPLNGDLLKESELLEFLEIIRKRGGKALDIELAEIVCHLYDLVNECNVDLFNEI